MARSTTIDTPLSADQAMGAARAALEQRGYLWEPQSDGGALAHEKGRRIEHRGSAWRVLIKVVPTPGHLALERVTSGVFGFLFGATAGLTWMLWADGEYRAAVNDVRAAATANTR